MRRNLPPVRFALRQLCVPWLLAVGLLAALVGAGEGEAASGPRCKKQSFDRMLSSKKSGVTFRRVSPCEVVERAQLGPGLSLTVRQVRDELGTEETFELEDERTPVEAGDPRELLRRCAAFLGRMPVADGAKQGVQLYREQIEKAEREFERGAEAWDPAAPLVVAHDGTVRLSVSQEAYGSGSKLVVRWTLAY